MTDTYRVSFSKEAYEDLRLIYAYIAKDLGAPSSAAKQVFTIKEAIEGLSLFPKRHPLFEGLKVRKMVVNRFLVFYLVSEAARLVVVVRIVYGGRDVVNLLAR